ncbi:MAG: ABC transporter substrate-binding protein [Patescibacteria group bacterium]|nr:ABC transporter substrate-binding protein [Patescibacteria group bacterium]
MAITIIFSGCQETQDTKILRVGLTNSVTSISPFSNEENSRNHLINLYEGLVRFDRNLQPEAALADAWGNIDQNTWEFHLRKAYFTDGSEMSGQDIINSFNLFKKYYPSSALTNNIKAIFINKKDAKKIIIQTLHPEPTLLRQLTKVFIVKNIGEEKWLGTGAFQLDSLDETKLTLKKNPKWWGSGTSLETVEFLGIPEKRHRARMIEDGEIDILAEVPPDIRNNPDPNILLKSLPKLSVTFLGFNLSEKINEEENRLAELIVRKAISLAINRANLTNQLRITVYAQPSSQFAGVNVFGFNSDINIPKTDSKEARILLNGDKFYLNLDFVSSMKKLAENIQLQLAKIGIVVKLNALTPEELTLKLQSGKSQMVIASWLADSGDAGTFFEKMIATNGSENYFKIANQGFDEKIAGEATLIEPMERLPILQNLMRDVVENEIIGVPLFEEEKVYAIRPNVQFVPRQDEAIFAPEVTVNS